MKRLLHVSIAHFEHYSEILMFNTENEKILKKLINTNLGKLTDKDILTIYVTTPQRETWEEFTNRTFYNQERLNDFLDELKEFVEEYFNSGVPYVCKFKVFK